ncbi:C39 family peptidase [Nocardioides sp. SYSU D00038]|uniref:C39 family peptidase n=1 Tax=Nocardioides sp. SYSU D00038 TaxID=2812554 RepID=UPI001966FD8A|nr:C39 family peptidase [Nocardioides sp. SYSU D00038]
MSRPRLLAIGALVVLLVAALFVPRGGNDDDGSVAPAAGPKSSLRPGAVGRVTVSAADRAEIERVVAEGQALGRQLGAGVGRELSRGSTKGLSLLNRVVPAAVRCADLTGQRYCLGVGWTDRTEAQVQAATLAQARTAVRRSVSTTGTGDLDLVASLERSAALGPRTRATAERAELTEAARAVAKVWQLRHEIEGVPLPRSLRAASRTGATATPTTAVDPETKTPADYPQRFSILDKNQVAEQVRSYWCGPASMQMITWGWKKKDLGQAHWARKLGTTTSGSSISAMVKVVNDNTGWDKPAYAGPYIVLDIGKWSYDQWMLLVMRHVADYRAPLVLHPVLRKEYYPYLDDNASGHFQVGRGYDQRGARPDLVGYFEPWNQARFDPSEPPISRVQWRNAYKSYRANKAHYQHNIGV